VTAPALRLALYVDLLDWLANRLQSVIALELAYRQTANTTPGGNQ
jgi:hypothetical protein